MLKTCSERAIEKTAEATGDLNGNKIANKIARVWKIWPKINSETSKEEILREINYNENNNETTDDLKLKEENYKQLTGKGQLIGKNLNQK